MSELALLRMAEVAKRVGLSKATIYRQISAGKFPSPIKVGERALWVSREIETWIEVAIARFRSAGRTGPGGPTAGDRDIMEELETEGLWLYDMGYPEAGKVMLDARDEIERLRAEVEQLRGTPE